EPAKPAGAARDESQKPALDKPATPAAARPSGGGKSLASLSLLLALGAIGASGYLWYAWQQARQAQAAQTAQMNERVEQAIAKLNQERSMTLDEFKAQLQAQLDATKTLQTDLQGMKTDLQGVKDTVAARLGNEELQQTALASLGQTLERQAGAINELGQRQQAAVDALNSRLEQMQLTQRGLLESLEAVKLAASKGGDINALPLTEVEYLLRIADHKLTLQRDIDAAVLALTVAEERLALIGEDAFNGVRTMIKENLATLRGVTIPDFSSLAHRVFELEQSALTLPLRTSAQIAELKERVRSRSEQSVAAPAAEEPSWWERLTTRAQSTLRDVVVIRHERASAPPLMAPENEFFLRQNVKLELEAMRLALLAQDAIAFQDANAQAREWLQTYFNLDDPQVTGLLKDLETLRELQFNPYVPDVSGTLKAFQDVLAKRQPVRGVNAAKAQEAQ
ncbi:MAG TPA: uroporphyrinogen-III C-methyltransferase, partial [Candidatus Competibacteraceae bacterium]|nr:uroporphyrinogen-III C-methyltransferase [Candidatus Competibacteraceae bacterium]